jgi:hypothetical protein
MRLGLPSAVEARQPESPGFEAERESFEQKMVEAIITGLRVHWRACRLAYGHTSTPACGYAWTLARPSASKRTKAAQRRGTDRSILLKLILDDALRGWVWW